MLASPQMEEVMTRLLPSLSSSLQLGPRFEKLRYIGNISPIYHVLVTVDTISSIDYRLKEILRFFREYLRNIVDIYVFSNISSIFAYIFGNVADTSMVI